MAISKIKTASILDSTIATADIADGAVTSVKTTGVGGANTPAFMAHSNSSTTMPNQTATKIAYANEVFDTDSDYDTSNSRFTPQTAGKYLITAQTRFNSDSDFNDNIMRIYKNGSQFIARQTAHQHYECQVVTGIVTLNGSSDYVEIYGYHNEGGNVDTDSGTTLNFFQGYKIII
jgi:hypothetical protein